MLCHTGGQQEPHKTCRTLAWGGALCRDTWNLEAFTSPPLCSNKYDYQPAVCWRQRAAARQGDREAQSNTEARAATLHQRAQSPGGTVCDTVAVTITLACNHNHDTPA